MLLLVPIVGRGLTEESPPLASTSYERGGGRENCAGNGVTRSRRGSEVKRSGENGRGTVHVCRVRVEREGANARDSNAMLVRECTQCDAEDGRKLGFVPAKVAEMLAPLLHVQRDGDEREERRWERFLYGDVMLVVPEEEDDDWMAHLLALVPVKVRSRTAAVLRGVERAYGAAAVSSVWWMRLERMPRRSEEEEEEEVRKRWAAARMAAVETPAAGAAATNADVMARSNPYSAANVNPIQLAIPIGVRLVAAMRTLVRSAMHATCRVGGPLLTEAERKQCTVICQLPHAAAELLCRLMARSTDERGLNDGAVVVIDEGEKENDNETSDAHANECDVSSASASFSGEGKWFRAASLKYKSIRDVEGAIQCLVRSGLVHAICSVDDIEALVSSSDDGDATESRRVRSGEKVLIELLRHLNVEDLKKVIIASMPDGVIGRAADGTRAVGSGRGGRVVKADLIAMLVDATRQRDATMQKSGVLHALVRAMHASLAEASSMAPPSSSSSDGEEGRERGPDDTASTQKRTLLLRVTDSMSALDAAIGCLVCFDAVSMSRLATMSALKLTYPSYSVTASSPAFQDRLALTTFRKALLTRYAVEDAIDRGDDELAMRLAEDAVVSVLSQRQQQSQVEPAASSKEHRSETAASHGSARLGVTSCERYQIAKTASRTVPILERMREYTRANELLRALICDPSTASASAESEGNYQHAEEEENPAIMVQQQGSNRNLQQYRHQSRYNSRGQWWIRLSINTEHLGRKLESLEIAEEALRSDAGVALISDTLTATSAAPCAAIDPASRLTLMRRVLRLGRAPIRWKRPRWANLASYEPAEVTTTGRPLSNVVGIKSRYFADDDTMCSVEGFALSHYNAPEHGGWSHGIHCEGGVWTTLFGLVMWDALFMDVPDAFQTQFQTCPSDMGTAAFYHARKSTINAILSKLRTGGARAVDALIRRNFAKNYGYACRGVRWDVFHLDSLLEIAACVGGAGIAAVCELMSVGGMRGSGMPDLLLWRPVEGGIDIADAMRLEGVPLAMCVEVKSRIDTLADKQRLWMMDLERAGIRCEVLKVVDVNSSRAADGIMRKRKNLHHR